METGSGRSARQHFGQGKLTLEPAKAVFINCPFDQDFEPTFDAIVFSVACCGFTPRSALESGDVAVSRMERIVRAIFSSHLSIHDLSRCRGEGDEQLARFNMPLELGIAMARRYNPEDAASTIGSFSSRKATTTPDSFPTSPALTQCGTTAAQRPLFPKW